MKLINKDGDKKYKAELKEQIEGLGYLRKILDDKKMKLESSKKTQLREVVEYENNGQENK